MPGAMTDGFSSNDSLKKLVKKIARDGPYNHMPTERRIRLLFNGAFISDTTSAVYVWEHEYYPQYYLPMESFIKPNGFDVILNHGEAITDDTSGKIVGGTLEVAVRREHTNEEYRLLNEMVLFAADLDGPAKYLRNYVKVTFNAADQWFEEDMPIYVHPKDPYKRVDTVQSNRPIRVTMPSGAKDIVLAESTTSVHLYETSLPARYYLPYTAIETIYLRPSKTTSECPYKGIAQYHHLVVDGKELRDVVWWYRAPTAECIAVTGLRCFYNEKVDHWFLEGKDWVKQERPQTQFA